MTLRLEEIARLTDPSRKQLTSDRSCRMPSPNFWLKIRDGERNKGANVADRAV
jgi:hypothetical protein